VHEPCIETEHLLHRSHQHFPDIINNGTTSRRSYFTARNRLWRRGLAKNKRTIGVEVSEEVVSAFEAGVVFGRMVEARRQRHAPLWSEHEWLQALIKAVGKKAESKVRSGMVALTGKDNRGTMTDKDGLRSLHGVPCWKAGVCDMAQTEPLRLA
jgi:hypothetical protein